MSQKFGLGRMLITPAAQAKLSEPEVHQAICRHVSGDWGDLDPNDRNENELSLCEGFRLFSRYRATDRTVFYVITEADRSVTTVLLPEDY